MGLSPSFQIGGVKGLGDKIRGPLLQGVLFGLIVVFGAGNHNHGQAPNALIFRRANGLQQLVTIHFGHVEIGKYHVYGRVILDH